MPRSPHTTRRNLSSVLVKVLAVSALAIMTALTSACSRGSNGGDEAPPSDHASVAAPPSPRETESGAAEISRTARITPSEAGEVEIGLVDLRVSGRLATLQLVFTPHFRSDRSGRISLLDMAGGRGGSVTLLDSTNLRRYLVVKDSRNESLGANPATTRTTNDQPVDATFVFAAPPAEVTSIGVFLDDREIFDDVKITR